MLKDKCKKRMKTVFIAKRGIFFAQKKLKKKREKSFWWKEHPKGDLKWETKTDNDKGEKKWIEKEDEIKKKQTQVFFYQKKGKSYSKLKVTKSCKRDLWTCCRHTRGRFERTHGGRGGHRQFCSPKNGPRRVITCFRGSPKVTTA